MTRIYGEDKVKLNPDRVSEGTDPQHGPTTVFHDTVIASEIVQPYPDGKAFKSRTELEKAAWTAEGRWVILGGHPEEAIISDQKQVSGRITNTRYVKDLIDPKTKRPNRAGVRSDIVIFNRRVPEEQLNSMKNGSKADVSIGFFYERDDNSGTVPDGPFKGDEYDYAQTNLFIDHLAAAIDNGRCPSPLCGLGADELKDKVGADPFSGFKSFEACVSEIGAKNPKLKQSQVEGICGKLKAQHEKKSKEDQATKKALENLNALMSEIESLKGERDALKTGEPWYRAVDWKTPENMTLFDSLSEETQTFIKDAGLCPACLDEAAKRVSHDASMEQIDKRIEELRTKRSDLMVKIRKISDKLYEDSPEEKKRKDEIRKQLDPLWEEMGSLDAELQIYIQAKTLKLTESLVKEEPKESGGSKKEEKPAVEEKKDQPETPPKEKSAPLDPYAVLKRSREILS